ncbi:MAG TPA: IPT/TIG domain-containing protein [Bryobacteraceae bacterium]|nr:IPT/TIG domain-containing protein [Bryobacteraceae bacterium]
MLLTGASAVVAAPSITSLSPTSGGAGTAVTIAGSNFGSSQSSSTVKFNGTSAGTAASWGATSVTVSVPNGATTGNVVVTVAGVASSGVNFTVIPAPTLTSVSPASGVQGASVPVTLSGANFVAGATVAVSNSGITVGSVTVVSATQITATLTIAAKAATGAANVTVTTSGGTSSAAVFTVKPPAPVLTSVSPASGIQGASVPVTFTGANFVAGAMVLVNRSGISVGNLAVVSTTQITATLTIAANAAPGAFSFTLATSGGASSAVGFTVNPPAPVLTSVSPASGVQGTSLPVTLAGSNFVTGATVAVSNPGVTAGSVTIVSATQITATLTIAANAALGAANVTVTTSGGTSGTAVFTVNPPAPVLTSVSPASGVQGTSVPVTLAGSNFVSGATVSATNSGVTVGGVTVVSAAQITATLTIAANAALGAAKVTVTTSGGTSGTAAFTVNPPAPVLTSVSPASAGQGAKPWLTLTGTNFAAGAIVAVSGTGTSVSAVIVTSATQITALFTIDPSAVPGARNVTVTTSAGTSNALPFTVIAVPSIGSVSPTTATGGTQVTIGGSYFGATRGTGSVWLGTAPATVVSWADTQIVATVASNAQSGNALVQQNGLASNSVPFTVITPNILTVTPTIGAPGDTVTIAGSHFGAAQGSGQVWLGTAAGVVQSWSDTQIVAQVGAGAASGNAQVLQNGVMSNAVAFTVNTPQIASISPTSGASGTLVTFTGSGFGASQGNVTLGSMAGQVQQWNDTQVTASVASSSVSGIARIQRSDGLWSNALGFTVPVAGGGGNTVMPSLLNMSVGDSRTLQALGANG